jgi:hypothetical protein
VTGTVLFVHGTGVRGGQYAAQFARVTANITQRRPGIRVAPCPWGDRLGAELHSGGLSVPAAGRAGDRGTVRPETEAELDWPVNQWALLDVDPLYELRALAALRGNAAEGGLFTMDGLQPGEVIDRARRLTGDPGLREHFASVGLADDWTAAAEELLNSSAAQEAAVHGAPADVAAALARALVAVTVRQAAARLGAEVPVLGRQRQDLVSAVTDRLADPSLGVRSAGSALAKTGAMLGWRWLGASQLERRRTAITDTTRPMAGDIMVYLSRGERIRRFISSCCRDAEPPVTLLGHSLGGVACLDLVVSERPAEVAGLVTVGSQGPFLYELDALPSLPYGSPLPDEMPSWTNFYDPRDLLAYVGGQIFPGQVTDIAVPSGNPFPFAHSDYFGNPEFYDALDNVLP